jgi:hypothetical protein
LRPATAPIQVLIFTDFVFAIGDIGGFPVKAHKARVFLFGVKTRTPKMFAFNSVVDSGDDFITQRYGFVNDSFWNCP